MIGQTNKQTDKQRLQLSIIIINRQPVVQWSWGWRSYIYIDYTAKNNIYLFPCRDGFSLFLGWTRNNTFQVKLNKIHYNSALKFELGR